LHKDKHFVFFKLARDFVYLLKAKTIMNSKFPSAVPEIPVSDLRKAATYYERCLGFVIDWGGDDGGIAGISKGNCRMFLTDNAFRAHSPAKGPVIVWFNLDSREQIDELYTLWRASQVKIVSPPGDKPWGLYEFTIADADGNLFRIFYDFATPERERNS
jgi:predicted lactoylglutathione lyase